MWTSLRRLLGRRDDQGDSAHVEKSSANVLPEAISSAQLLVAHAAERGISIDPEVWKILLAAKYSHEKNALDQDDEAAFWQAYKELCRAVNPVTPESLKVTCGPAWETVSRYQWRAVAAMVALMIVQIYWVFLSELTVSAKEFNNAYEKHHEQEVDRETKLRAIFFQSSSETDPWRWNDRSSYKGSPKEKEALDLFSDLEKARVNFELIEDKYGPDYELMEKLLFRGLVAKVRILLGLASADRHNDQTQENVDTRLQKDNDQTREYGKTRQQKPQFLASIIVRVMSLYILPFVYGLVGAYAYALRVLSNKVRNRTLTASCKIELKLRILLGALAGLSIAWFVKGGEAATAPLGNITPLALAFLAGYGVELLYSAMDALIRAFSREPMASTSILPPAPQMRQQRGPEVARQQSSAMSTPAPAI